MPWPSFRHRPLSKIAKCAGKVLGFSLLFQAVRAWISSTFSNLARSGEEDLLSFINSSPFFPPQKVEDHMQIPRTRLHLQEQNHSIFAQTAPGTRMNSPQVHAHCGSHRGLASMLSARQTLTLFLSSTTQHEPRHGNWTSTLGNCFSSNKEMEIGNHSPNQDSVG